MKPCLYLDHFCLGFFAKKASTLSFKNIIKSIVQYYETDWLV